MLKVLNAEGKGIVFPTHLSEVNADVYEHLLENIVVPKYRCIVAMLMETKLFNLVSTMKYSKESTVNVETFIAKVNEVDKEGFDINVGDKIVIDRSSIERGIHLHIKQPISQKYVARFFEVNKDLTSDILKGNYDSILNNNNIEESNGIPSIYLLEFKIVNISDISAAVKVRDKVYNNPFIIE